MARLLAFNPKTGEFTEFKQKTLDDFYKHLGCDTFDIAYLQIGKDKNKCFDFFVDDVGLFVEDNLPSAITENYEVRLVGNIVFANHDLEGNTTDLSDEDINYIKSNYIGVGDAKTGKKWYSMYPVDYPRR